MASGDPATQNARYRPLTRAPGISTTFGVATFGENLARRYGTSDSSLAAAAVTSTNLAITWPPMRKHLPTRLQARLHSCKATLGVPRIYPNKVAHLLFSLSLSLSLFQDQCQVEEIIVRGVGESAGRLKRDNCFGRLLAILPRKMLNSFYERRESVFKSLPRRPRRSCTVREKPVTGCPLDRENRAHSVNLGSLRNHDCVNVFPIDNDLLSPSPSSYQRVGQSGSRNRVILRSARRATNCIPETTCSLFAYYLASSSRLDRSSDRRYANVAVGATLTGIANPVNEFL